MQKINTNELPDENWPSPDAKTTIAGKEISEALGRIPHSADLTERHPFDVEIQRVAPGTAATHYHSHSAQWEFYHIVSGNGTVRHVAGVEPIVSGDAFIFKPGEPHQITAGTAELVMYVIADNPIGDKGTILDPG